MNSNEGMTLVKMSVTALLTVLIIGAVMSLWYVLSNSENKMSNDLERSVTSGTTSRLYDLSDQSLTADADDLGIEGHPLVSTVAHAISEFNNTDLLYIYVTAHTKTGSGDLYNNCYLYTYPGINISDTSALPHGHSTITQINDSQVPVTQAVKNMLQYTQHRCHLTVSEVPYKDNTYIGIIVEVLIPGA